MLIAALVGAVLHWGEMERFGQMLRIARPAWLAAAAGLQLSTSGCVAAGSWAAPRRAGTPLSLLRLTRIAVTKQFDRLHLVQVAACTAVMFMAEVATLQLCLHALGQATSFGIAFMGSMMAAILVTLGPLPLFEATCVATLRLPGMPF